MSNEIGKFYVDGRWIDPPSGADVFPCIDPATETEYGFLRLATAIEVDLAVGAARRAFTSYAATGRDERLALLRRVADVYRSRYDQIAEAITLEMGAPLAISKQYQAALGLAHIESAIDVLANFEFREASGTTAIVYEPVGVCALITPWNWPVNQIMCKVAPALAAGCTMVLKPSEFAPLSAHLVAQVMHEAGVPPGVFNMIYGDGPAAGAALAKHAHVDMISLTGSNVAGAEVSRAAAETIKRVSLELGGKSANIVLDDADLVQAVREGVQLCFLNSGQSCNAPTRLLVPAARLSEALAAAREAAQGVAVGPPKDPQTHIGPQANPKQWCKTQRLIAEAIETGMPLVAGGVGRPVGFASGCYTRPTVFGPVPAQSDIARTEVFGPVLCIIPYDDEEDAIAIANDSPYGLSGYVQSASIERARAVASRLRTGMVHLNGAPPDVNAPFGGYKRSGNGREWGRHGFTDFLEVKAIMGHDV